MQVTPELLILGVMLAGLILYVLLGGADYGGGMWDLLATGPRARRQREAIAHAIGPVWEANHVWLILVIVLLFSAFPPAFGAIMTALHIPMTLILIGIVMRGAAFVFRKYDAQDDAVHRRWSTLFGVASFLTPFLLGLSLGGLATGAIRADGGRVLTGFLAGWTTLFAVACGLFTQGLFAFLAATYLTLDTADDRALQDDFRIRALLSGVLLLPAAVAVFALASHDAPRLFEGLIRPWAPFLLAATSVAAVAALVGLYRRRYALARAAAIAQVTAILLGWAFAQFPYLIPASLTYRQAAGPRPVLTALVWALAAGSAILLPSLWYLFRTFKSREGSGDAEF
jgi:cytochrome d ubiquinol oxidase subunit II